MTRHFMTAASLLMAAGPVLAETAERNIQASAELGYVSTTGNTETKSLNAKANGQIDRESWRHTVALEALKTSDHDTTTAERYTANLQSDYKVGTTKKNYLFVMLNYEDDRFSGYDYRVTEAIGYGRRVIETEKVILDLEAGPGARQSKLDNGDTDSETMIRGAAKLGWNVSDTSKFTEELSADVGEDATVTKSITGLTAKVNDSLATKITYTIKNTSKVPDGFEKTDTETAVTLVYTF